MWWNWQTWRTQNPLMATSCGFESHHRHQKKALLRKCFFKRNPPNRWVKYCFAMWIAPDGAWNRCGGGWISFHFLRSRKFHDRGAVISHFVHAKYFTYLWTTNCFGGSFFVRKHERLERRIIEQKTSSEVLFSTKSTLQVGEILLCNVKCAWRRVKSLRQRVNKNTVILGQTADFLSKKAGFVPPS